MREVDARETKTMKIWLGEDGVVRQQCLPGARITGDEARRVLECTRDMLGDVRRPLLVLASGTRAIEREARQILSGELAAELHEAVAILVDSALVSAIASFFVGLNRSPVPVKLFRDEAAALRWLEDHREG
jgi:hypothetical protein